MNHEKNFKGKRSCDKCNGMKKYAKAGEWIPCERCNQTGVVDTKEKK